MKAYPLMRSVSFLKQARNFKTNILSIRAFLKSVATLVTIVVAILLLSTKLVVYISPALLGYFTYFGFLFPLFFLLNVIFLVFWVIKWRTQFLIPLIVLVLMWPQWSQTFQLGWHFKGAKGDRQSVTILSYNVRMFDFYDWTKVSGNAKRLFEFINKQDADVVCIQEFFTSPNNSTYKESYINRNLSRYPFHHIDYTAHEFNTSFGMATYSKYPIVRQESMHFPNTTNSSIATDIVVKGETIRVFNNHLESLRLTQDHLNLLDSLTYQTEAKAKKGLKEIAYRMKGAFATRTLQADQLDALIKKSPYPVFVCGDFNDTPISYVYHKMKGDLLDSFVAHGKGFGGTYHGFIVPFRIDFLFHSRSLVNIGYQCFPVPYSDHYPIVGEFLLP